MFEVFRITLKGIFRDRVFHGILVAAVLLPLVPSVSQLSMRQVTELSITLSLSLISFILLLLSVFLGGTSLWKDIDRRYTFSVLSLPISRTRFLLGRFLGLAAFLLLAALVLGVVACVVVSITAGNYPPDRPVVWGNVFAAIVFDALKYILLVAAAVALSTVSTSFFLPVFGTIATMLVGSASQQVYEYVQSPAGEKLTPLLRQCANALYYVLPNFSAFDLKVNAIYGVPLSGQGTLLTVLYFAVYVAMLLLVATVLFSRREMK
ncbi:membrane protein [Geomonas limicola]|uniref:Membrane protein n=1 Tax=Geomonas limicola TaxID=2740186 RepID=A0A6V8N2J4_9BACT|nr:ABC transporter permease subunit [Geomonas limicola]GFO66742.1 membrane protein [Geomonas limicola]